MEGEGMPSSKHSAVIAAFGHQFAHAGRAPVEFNRFLLEPQYLRQNGDYGPRHAVTLDRIGSKSPVPQEVRWQK